MRCDERDVSFELLTDEQIISEIEGRNIEELEEETEEYDESDNVLLIEDTCFRAREAALNM